MKKYQVVLGKYFQGYKSKSSIKIMKNKLLILFTFTISTIIFLLSTDYVSAVTCTSQASGNWNNTGTWSGCTGGNGTTPNTPGSNDTAIITSNHTVTVTVSETVNALQFNAASTAGSVSINSGISLTVTTSITLLHNTGANTSADLTGSGSVSAASITIGSDGSFSSGTYTATFTSSVSSLTTSGNITIASYIGVNTGRIGNSIFNHSTGTITIQGTLTTTNENAVNTSTYTMATGSQNGTLNLSGATPFNISATGTSTITLNGSSAVVNYNSSSAQTVRGTTYTTLKINNANSSGATLGAEATVSTLTIGDVTSNSIFNDGGYQITSTGTLNLTSGKFKLGGSSATTWPSFTTVNISPGTTVEYGSTASQTYSTSPTYHHLTFSGASTKSPSSTSMTVNGNLTISSGTLTAPSGNLTLKGNFTNSGSFTHNSGTIIFAGDDSSTQTISGNTTFYNFSASTNSNSTGRTLEFTGSSTTTVSGTWTITGYSGKIITLQSSDSNNWTINPTNSSVTYVDVKRSTNSGNTFCASYSTKDAYSINWYVSGGEKCSEIPYDCVSNTTSGNWSSPSSWTSCGGSTPQALDRVTILNGHTISLNTDAEIARINIQNGATLTTDNNNRSLTLSDTSNTLFTLGSSGTFTAGNSTVIMNPNSSTTLISGTPTFYNLTLSPTITSDRTYSLGSSFSVSNNFTINPTATSSYRLTVNMGGDITVSGTTLISGTTSALSTLDTRPSTTDYNLSTGNLTIATAGTLDADGSSSTITLTGTSGTLFTRSGTFNSGNTTAIVTGGNGTTLNSGTISFYNLTISPSGDSTISTSADDITVTNTLNIVAGDTLSLYNGQDFTHSGATLTLNGTISGDGLYIYQSSTAFPTSGVISADLRMDATNNNQSLGARTYGGDVEIYNNSGSSARTVTLGTAGSQTLTFSGNLTLTSANTQAITLTASTYNPNVNVNGNFTIGSNTTYTASSNTGNPLTIGGNFTNNGTFTNNSGEVIFNDNSKDSVLSGSGSPAITFHNLKVATAGKTIKFTAGQTFRTNGLLTLTGSSGPTYVYLTSTTTSPWYINHQGTESISYAHVSYSQCDGSCTEISADNGTNYDGGGNGACWVFSSTPPVESQPNIRGNINVRGGVRIK